METLQLTHESLSFWHTTTVPRIRLVAPERVPEIETLAGIRDELERQAHIYRGLGISKDVIMRLAALRPDSLPIELKIPVVTLGASVNLQRQADLAGIETYYSLSRGYDTAGGITFDAPRLIWMQDGSKYTGNSVNWVRNHLRRNERPATQYDCIAFAIINPNFQDILRNHGIDIPGTSVEPNTAPCLFDCLGRPGLDHGFVDDVSLGYGSASCGG